MSELTKNLISSMINEDLKLLASKMFNPLRCGGACYDEDGNYYLIIGGIKRNVKEINLIIKKMNPAWSDEALEPYFCKERNI